MPSAYSEDDLAGLNPAERAIAMAEDDDEGYDEDTPVDMGDNDDEGDTPPAKVEAIEAVEAVEEDPELPLKFERQSPDNAAQTRDDLSTQKSDAFKQLMDGEIDADAYQTIEKSVDVELTKLLQASITDSVTDALTQAQTEKAWANEVKALVKSAVSDGLDYNNNEPLKDEFNSLVRVFGAEATTKGMDDTGLKASKWALQQAHEVMKMRHGKVTAKQPSAESRPARAKADLSTIPPSLSKAPVAAGIGVTDEFAHMGGLRGSDMEKAFARLSSDAQDRYLA